MVSEKKIFFKVFPIIYKSSYISIFTNFQSPFNTSPGLPLTSRLRKVPDFLPLEFENLGSPTFFRAAVVCPLFSRTYILISVSHRIIMIYTSFKCVLKHPYRLLKFDRIFLESPYLYVGPHRKHQHWYNFAFVSKPRERKKENKIHERKGPNMFP